MDILCKIVGILCIFVMLQAKAASKLKSCEGRLVDKENGFSPCIIEFYEPLCLLCNASRSFEEISWFVEDKMLAEWGRNNDADHAGGVSVNDCIEYEKYSLKLERPTEDSHNSLYYCQRFEKNISFFILKLHADVVMSINSSDVSYGRLFLGYKNSTKVLQCDVTTTAPRLTLTWSLNDVLKDTKTFNTTLKGAKTFSYTYKFINLNTDDLITCSSKGIFITSGKVSLIVYVVDKHKEDTPGSRFELHSRPNDIEYRVHGSYTIWIPSGIVLTLLICLTIMLYTRHKKKNSLNTVDVSPINSAIRNTEPSESTYEPYSLIGNDINSGEESAGIAGMSLVSKMKSSGIYEYWTGTYNNNENKEECFIKSLSGQATLQEASDFQALAKRMKALKNSPSVIRLLCINIEENPFAMVYELFEYGTLRDFVMSRYQTTSIRGTEATNMTTQIRELLAFATNVADAMMFVESQNFRHPVLSLKRVLLTEQCRCKLYDICPADMALTKIDEVQKKTRPPTAWMAPETIFLHQYSLASDVWSYSTLLWELFSLGEAPYAGTCSKDIEDKIRKGVFLPQPNNCPETVYGTMLSAWAKVADFRPSFNVMFEKLNDVFQSIEEEEASNASQYFTLEPPATNHYI